MHTEPPSLPGQPLPLAADRVLSVAEVTAHVKRLIESDELLSNVIVRGEISNFTRATSGHLYFSLKDESCQLGAVCFRGAAAGLKFDPGDGDRVVAGGSITVYEKAGRYQLIIRFMRPDGAGDLAAALELLKAKLAAEGLFDPARKRPLPRFPRAVAVCTSSTGAAYHDMKTILERRWPLAQVIPFHTAVQGAEAIPGILKALDEANANPEVDVIILGRGGGSIEDLWAFNEEPVARAIYASQTPVISAVGHETDWTVADLVADVRAATPSNAAEIAVPDIEEIKAGLNGADRRLRSALLARLNAARVRLERAAAHPLLQRPGALIEQQQMRVDDAVAGLSRLMSSRLERGRARLERVVAAFEALSPTAVLQRGYAICRLSDGTVVRSVGQLRTGDAVRVRVSDGEVGADVTSTNPLAGEQA